jgi:transposase
MKSSQIDINFPNNSGRFLSVFQRKYLEKSLEKGLSKPYSQRIQIMLLADEGKTQTQICQELGCSHSTARHWITLAKSGQAHQWNNNAIGRPQTIDDRCLQRLKKLVTQSPKEVKVPNRDFTYSAQQWTAKKLSEHLGAEFGIKISDRHINRLLKKMGLSTRPKQSSIENNDNPTETNRGIVINDIHTRSPSINNEETLFSDFLKNQGFIDK